MLPLNIYSSVSELRMKVRTRDECKSEEGSIKDGGERVRVGENEKRGNPLMTSHQRFVGREYHFVVC